MVRFRSLASEESYQQAMLFMMTMPGIPVIYQGTEQGEKDVRAPLFNKLDAHSPEFQFVKKTIALRKENAPTRRGKVEVLADSEHCPGLLLYRLRSDGDELYVAFNTTEHALLTNNIFLNNDDDANGIEEVLSLRGGSEWYVEKGEIRQLILPAKEGLVFKIKKEEPTGIAAGTVRPLNSTDAVVKKAELLARAAMPDADSGFVFIDGNLMKK